MVSPVREKNIESYLLAQCRKHGFLCLKFTSPGRAGVPDRLLVTPAATVFVEVKRPGETPRKQQVVMHHKIRRFGGQVHVVDSETSVDALITHLRAGGTPQPAPLPISA